MLLNASGCLDALTAPDVARSLDAFVTKTVTPLPREGNAPARIAETDVGMLNAIGLANPGIDRFLTRNLPQLEKLGVPFWVSVGGFQTDDYAEICSRLDDHAEVSAIELNVSCPNVEAPVESTTQIVAAARLATRKPLWAKLSPAVPDVGEVAKAAQAAGADGLSLVNTLRGLKLDARTLRPVLGPGHGGLSGPALKPIALAAVATCYRAHGVAQDPGRGTDSFARPTDGSAEESERHPGASSPAEEGPQRRPRPDRTDPQQPSRVRLDRKGLRHVDGGAEVRAGQGGALSEHVPDQSVEDGGRALRPPAL